MHVPLTSCDQDKQASLEKWTFKSDWKNFPCLKLQEQSDLGLFAIPLSILKTTA